MNKTQGLAELVAHWRGFADVFASLDGPTNNALTVRMREMADELEAALSQQPAAGAVAWTWERFISEGFCGDGGYWLREYGDERPEILFQEDLDDPTKYRGLQPLYAKGAQHEQ